MVFAAGLGTRMRPLTDRVPKPLIQVAGKALLDYALDSFERAGCERIVVNTHYLGAHIEAHLASRVNRTQIVISAEDPVLETGGGVVRALDQLGDRAFFSANSDTIWMDGAVPAISRLRAAFDPATMDALLLLHPLEQAVGYRGPGNFDLDEAGWLVRSRAPKYVFTGLQILHPRLFAGRREEPFSLRELYQAAEGGDGVLRRMAGLVHDGSWLHVGTPEELREAEAYLRSRP
jgi:N-acetyl-alpha-D-muramate 1-phosphate uridylyltransferase